MTDFANTSGGIARPGGGAAQSPAEAAFPRLDGVEHRFVDLPGLRMHVAEAGRGEPVLLLHGIPQHWWEWRKVVPGLAEHYRVICPDLRGAGWTDAPRKGYGRDQLVADVVALLDALELDRVHLLTHDVGGLVGYQLCLRHPDRVKRHLSLSIPPPYFGFDGPMVRAIVRRAWWNLVVWVPVLGRLLFGKGRQRMVRYMLDNFTSDQDALSEEDVELFLSRLREPTRARAGSALYRNLILPEVVRILGGSYRRSTRLSTPTRALVGADDPNIRPEFLHGYEDYVDDLELDFVDGASHFVANERPDVVLERALEFFAKP
jgi:pimeloyl-ACP methyl ester carboxylesterase